MFYRKRGKAMRWFFGWFKISLPGLLAGGSALVSTSALALDIKAWKESINRETKERYIPVELWAGRVGRKKGVANAEGRRHIQPPYRHISNQRSHRVETS